MRTCILSNAYFLISLHAKKANSSPDEILSDTSCHYFNGIKVWVAFFRNKTTKSDILLLVLHKTRKSIFSDYVEANIL